MDFDQDTEAVDRFDATMIECFPGFPDMSDPGFIKIEPEGPDAEYERSSFDWYRNHVGVLNIVSK